MDEDVYLVDLMFPKNGHHVLARLIDEYSNWVAPISAAVLRSDNGGQFYLNRDPGCDIMYGEMVLRTAPGDLIAILPERLGYQPILKKAPVPSEALPCYRIAEQSENRVLKVLFAIVHWR